MPLKVLSEGVSVPESQGHLSLEIQVMAAAGSVSLVSQRKPERLLEVRSSEPYMCVEINSGCAKIIAFTFIRAQNAPAELRRAISNEM